MSLRVSWFFEKLATDIYVCTFSNVIPCILPTCDRLKTTSKPKKNSVYEMTLELPPISPPLPSDIKNYTIFLSKTRQKCEQSWTVLQDFLGRLISLGHCMGIYDIRFKIVLRPLPDLPHLTGFCLSWIMHWIDFCRL